MRRELQRLITILGMLAVSAASLFPNASCAQDNGLDTRSFAEWMEQGIELEKDHRWQESIQLFVFVLGMFPV